MKAKLFMKFKHRPIKNRWHFKHLLNTSKSLKNEDSDQKYLNIPRKSIQLGVYPKHIKNRW